MSTALKASEASNDRDPPPAPSPERVGAPSAPGAGARKTLLIVAAAIVALAAAGGFGWWYWTVGRFELSTDDAYVQAHIVNIAPEVSGYVVTVGVQDNQAVRAGDVLAVIDPVPYQAAVRQAEAGVAHARAMIGQAEAEVAAQPSVIEEARAMTVVSAAVLRFAQENMDRYGTLAEEGAGTRQSREQAASQLAQAQARLELDRAALRAADKRTAALAAELAGARAALRQNEAALETARFNLSRTTLRAPVDGVVGNRALRLGGFVQPGTRLLALVPLKEVFVVANYKETNLAGITPGQPVSIVADAYPDTPVRGVVNSISPAAGQTFALLPPDNATGNFTKIVQRVPVKITIDPADPLAGRLRPGMSVTTTIVTDADKTGADKTGARKAEAGAPSSGG